MARRRFGVSVSESVAEWLDKLAKALGVDRSRLVEEALSEYLHGYEYLYRHRCRGVIVAASREAAEEFARVVEEYRDVVRSSSHHHLGGLCVEVLVVEGESPRVAGLYSALQRIKGCSVRYVPLMDGGGRG